MSILKNLFKRQYERIEQIHDSFDNLELKRGTTERPPHLIAHGEIQFGGQLSEIRTAISVRTSIYQDDDDIEFSTNVGQLPNNLLGNSIVEGLNHRLEGKFVTFDSAEQAGNVDVVYTSRKPADWLDKPKISRELENHAKTQALVRPIMANSPGYVDLPSNVTFPEIKNLAQNIVDTGLGLPQLPELQHSKLPSFRDSIRERFKPSFDNLDNTFEK